jgi:hypothetical protein
MHSRGCGVKPAGIILGQYGVSDVRRNLQTMKQYHRDKLSKYRDSKTTGKTNLLHGKK